MIGVDYGTKKDNPDEAPVNSPYGFLAFCGIVSLGRLMADNDTDLLKTLRR